MTFVRNHRNYLALLLIILLVKAIWACFEISTGYISLDPDEAQYWTWSRNLDFGFYSKPPGIAWQIYLGCKLFGHTELGVRFFSVVFATLTALATYYLVFKMNLKASICFWASIIQAVSPIGLLGTFAATTDVGFIFFWTLALIPFIIALGKDEVPNYFYVGILTLCGALFKWTMFALWPLILISGFFFRKFYSKKLLYGFAISLLALLPCIIWNMNHEWATFRHVFGQSVVMVANKKGNFFEFLGAQVAILSPIFFVLFLLALLDMLKKRKTIDRRLLFCGLSTAIVLAFYLLYSLKKKMHGNWGVFAYPASTVVIAWYAVDVLSKGRKWLMRGTAFSLTMVSLLIAIPFTQKHAFLPDKVLPYKINPFRGRVGWKHLQSDLKELSENRDCQYFFSDSYQMASLLSFYGPQKQRQYFLNISGRRKNQFSFWPSLADEHKGESGYFVWGNSSRSFLKSVEYEKGKAQKNLSPYFDKVEFVKIIPLFTANNQLVKGALVFYCENYNGEMPENPKKY